MKGASRIEIGQLESFFEKSKVEDFVKNVKEIDPRQRKDAVEFFYSIQFNEDVVEGKIPDTSIEERVKEFLDYYTEGKHHVVILEDEENIYGVAYLSILSETAWLWAAVVNPQFRGKGIAKILTDKRIEIARELGCKEVEVEISAKNPHSLASKFSQGFILKSIDINGCFDLVKNLEGNNREPFGSPLEVPLSNETLIRKVINEGYYGVDIKNTYTVNEEIKITDPSDMDPTHWTLIFVKTN